MKKLTFGLLISLSLYACRKFEGEGGRASITGKVVIEEHLYIGNNPNPPVDTVTYPAAKEDLYIIYGDGDQMYDDKIDVSYDGSFKFEFLQPGTYTIFGYSKILHLGVNLFDNDDDYTTLEAVSKKITIGKKENVDIGTITLYKNKKG